MVKVEKLDNNEAVLTITVSKEDFESAVDNAFLEAQKTVEVKGFRKGHVPRKHFEKVYGVQSLYSDAVNECINKTYPSALKESELKVVSQPEIDLKFEEVAVGNELVYTAKVTLFPEITLGEYKGISVVKKSTDVTDEEVNNEINRLLLSRAELVDKDGDVLENDDIAIMDYEGFVGEEAFAGGKATNAELTIGSGQFIPGFEAGMVGMKKGETRDVLVTFPTEYHAENLAGQEAKFVVTLHEIKNRITPELNDELASELDKEANTKELFTEKIKNNLVNRKTVESDNGIIDELVNAVTKNATLSVPTVMVDQEVEEMIEDAKRNAAQYKIDFETFISFNGYQTIEDYKEELEVHALTSVRQKLVLEQIAITEDIQVSEELVEKTYLDLAARYGLELEDVKTRMPEAYLKMQLLPQATIEFLKETANIVSE